MAAYCLFENVEIIDEAKMEEYKGRAPEVVEKFGGRYIEGGGKVETIEGDWQLNDAVMIEFPDLTAAHRWYDSEEYRELKALGLSAEKSNAVFIEGI